MYVTFLNPFLMNTQNAKMLMQYYEYFGQYYETISKSKYDTVQCIACETDYIMSQMVSQKYVTPNEAKYISHCLFSQDIICNYCIRVA